VLFPCFLVFLPTISDRNAFCLLNVMFSVYFHLWQKKPSGDKSLVGDVSFSFCNFTLSFVLFSFFFPRNPADVDADLLDVPVASCSLYFVLESPLVSQNSGDFFFRARAVCVPSVSETIVSILLSKVSCKSK
jgi:hypothetical protein